MARLIQQLTEAKIRALTKVGLHPDGAGLYLQIRPGGARSWIYRFTLNSRTRDMGLGALADVSLVKARDKASAARALVNDGIDPIEHNRAQAVIPVASKRNSAAVPFPGALPGCRWKAAPRDCVSFWPSQPARSTFFRCSRSRSTAHR